ncbi:hypothetical protein [Natronococcus jeotgali]|uniref:Uncharacterized protein n=1 Tax=Natronococcus jeotgali DSM 18795 TaxID=1227498 RepID=L9XJS0_9EURY|nr:hypothetical protein [Natronococcus jeotgali]ELY61970.1 hypothetical protein C492_08615 [Natronococcus jeotgali DSM 18795]
MLQRSNVRSSGDEEKRLLEQTRNENLMSSDSESSREQTFPSPVDLLSTLEACNIQYLDIDETRALVIYQTAILNLEVLEGLVTLGDGAAVSEPADGTDESVTDRLLVEQLGPEFGDWIGINREATGKVR